MNTFLKTLTLFVLLGIISCRNLPENDETDINNILTGKASLVEINVSNTEFANNNLENDLISENNTWGGVIL